jgi:hypothetical protein
MCTQRCKDSRHGIVRKVEEICHGKIADSNRAPLTYPVLDRSIPDNRAGKSTGFL